MKHFFLIILALGTIGFVFSHDNDRKLSAPVTDAKTASEKLPPGPVPGTRMTDGYVRQVAQMAYLWGWPLVNVYNRYQAFTHVTETGLMGGMAPMAPINRLCMLHDYVTPEGRLAACPNQDVVYGLGIADFDQDAVVVQVPDFGKRFWVYQVGDLRTDAFVNIGRMYASQPGFYLLCGPGWKGKVPEGITASFRCPTRIAYVIPRVFMSDDPSDKKAVQAVINQITMYPLKEFDGRMKVTDWKNIKILPSPATGNEETKWVVPELFFEQLPLMLKLAEPLPGEESMYAQMQFLLDEAGKDPALKAKLKTLAVEYEASLIKPLFQFENIGVPARHHWTTQMNGSEFGTDYLTRTAMARSNIFVNRPAETKYFYQDLDEHGSRLSGQHKYTVTYPRGQLPDVKGFWSLTLYNGNHFFEPNPIKRYSLGTKNKTLKLNADSSLTIYVQHTAPPKDKLGNWLPCGEGNFSLYQRCYWPGITVLNGEWSPPPVKKTP